METREQRQARVDRRVAELRAQAADKETQAERLRGSINGDSAFWTQPAYSNNAGRSFARSRERERSKIIKAGQIYAEAKELRDQANVMEARGAVMDGDAAAAREAKIASVQIEVGQVVNTVHYGLRKVLKVNAKSVLVEGSFGPLKVEKQFIRVAA